MTTARLDTATLYRSHAAEVSRWVRSLAGPEVDIEDLVQEVFVIAHRSDFRGDSTASTWLFGIAANLVKRHRRVQRLRQWLAGSAADVAGTRASSDTLAPELLARRQAQKRVHRVLKNLHPALVDYKGLTRYRDAVVEWLAPFDDGAPTTPGNAPE